MRYHLVDTYRGGHIVREFSRLPRRTYKVPLDIQDIKIAAAGLVLLALVIARYM